MSHCPLSRSEILPVRVLLILEQRICLVFVSTIFIVVSVVILLLMK
jgi:hypothetical protein